MVGGLQAWRVVLLGAALAWVGCPASAEERTHVTVSKLEDDGNGLPVLEVKLHSLKRKNTTRTFRFLLDTGTAAILLDPSVPSEFFWDEPLYEAQVIDAAGATGTGKAVTLKRVEVGGLIRDGVAAVVSEVKSGLLGQLQDQPVDGVLGISFLQGLRFTLNARERRVEWWGLPADPSVWVPMTLGVDLLPRVALKVEGDGDQPCLVDTGNNGGIVLPPAVQPQGGGRVTLTGTARGSILGGREQRLPRVHLGEGWWADVPVNFTGGNEVGNIGQDVWGVGIACFDFSRGLLGLEMDAEGRLPLRRNPARTLPVVWDRTGQVPKLRVLLVKPGSELERAKFQVGDEIVAVDGLQVPQLNRAGLSDRFRDGEAHDFTVIRQGKSMTWRWEPGSQTLSAP